MICLYIQTSIFDGQIVPRCKWDNVALGQLRIVTWFTHRYLHHSVEQNVTSWWFVGEKVLMSVSSKLTYVKSRFYRTRTDQTRHFLSFIIMTTTFNYTEKLTLRHQLTSYSCIDALTLLVDDVNVRQIGRTKGKSSVDTSLSVLKYLLNCSAQIG